MPTTEWLNKYEAIKDKLTCKDDLEAHFTEKVIGNMAVDVLDIGAVHFPTGQIFACDPLVELDTGKYIWNIIYANGAASRTLSKRSRIPPCPGNILPKSFTEHSRFTSDAERSPTTPSPDITSAITVRYTQFTLNVCTPPFIMLSISSYAKLIITAKTPDVIIPPTKPSHVFLGLIAGHILCLPKNVPTKYAPASPTHALTIV